MEKVIKASQLVISNHCSYKAFLIAQGISTKKTEFTLIKPAILAMFQIPYKDWTEELIISKLSLFLTDEHMELTEQRKEIINEYAEAIRRLGDYCDKEGLKPVLTNFKCKVKVENLEELIDVPIDVIFEYPTGIRLYANIKDKSYYKVRVPNDCGCNEDYFSQSIQAYLMSLVAIQVGQSESHVGVFFLRTNSEKTMKFTPKPNYHFAQIKVDEILGNSQIQARLAELCTAQPQKYEGKACQICKYKAICMCENPKLLIFEAEKGKQLKEKASRDVVWTKDQQDIIHFNEGICRVNAVPGSGKTTVIANRTLTLLKSGVKPECCLLITFTEKGCLELKEKIQYWLVREGMNPKIAERIHIHTFNSLGYTLIQSNYGLLGFSNMPTLIDQVDKITIISSLLNEIPKLNGFDYRHPIMNHPNAKGVYFEVLDIFESLKKFLTNNDYEVEKLKTWLARNYPEKDATAIYHLFERYKTLCFERGLVDFDDQIILGSRLLVVESIRRKLNFEHIVVDEVQDTNYDQMEMINLLTQTQTFKSLIICGDDAQSIYGFRGGTQEIILNFHNMYENVFDFNMVDNFRSTHEISDFANQLNAHNVFRIKKEMLTHKRGKKPRLITGELMENIVVAVSQSIQAGTPLSEIAIISRTRKELLLVKDLLIEAGIPISIEYTNYLYEDEVMRMIFSLVLFMKDETNTIELMKFVQFLRYGEYEASGFSIEWLKEATLEMANIIKLQDESQRYARLYELIGNLSIYSPAMQVLKEMVDQRQLNTYAKLVQYLIKVVNYQSMTGIQHKANESVVLTTAHASKGREFETVIILIDKFKNLKFPLDEKDGRGDEECLNTYFKDELKNDEEERRLLYVAITRAKKELILLSNTVTTPSLRQEIEFLLGEAETSNYVTKLREFVVAYSR